nr:M23 family metallopeptidase [Phascolarctobacterium succinatutens]
MEKKKLGGLLLALWLAVLPIYVALCFADTADDKRAELNDVRQRMERMQTRKEQARRKAESASAELSEVMGSLNELQAQANNLQKKSDALQGKINDNQAKLEKKQQEMQERMQIYRKRLRDIYINGQINYLDVLLGAKDFSDFSSRMYLLQKIISRDLELLEKLKQDAAEINSRKEQLAAEMKEIKATQTELEAKKAKVNKLREQRAYMLYKAQEEEQSSQEEYERLLAISENIASMLRNMEAGGGGAPAGQGGTGQFMWPCNGPITSYYGWRTHPIFGTTKYHSGMDIAVDSGTPIHAADSGTVVYSGWLGGYGNCIMIDHGGGLVTLYAHNSALNVGEGQYVSKGTVVAYAGSTGYSTGPHCHFEVRLHGELTEPLNYLP